MNTVPRLTDIFSPTNYHLSLDLSRAKDRTFSGLVDISGVLAVGNEAIVLHSKDLEIKSVLVNGKTAEFLHGEFDALTISQEDLKPGEHLVTITFSGTITDAMHGLYPCYFEHDGVKKELFATQFESHHAREVFPCVDEPAAKATYDLVLTTTPDITVLGNMPITQQRTENGLLVTQFDQTPIMSSYLLAFVIGELHKKTATTKRGIEVNVWATPAHTPESLDFGLDIATRTIDFFEEYFDTEYPLPKSDHVALPDFSSGAMENWGLITYRESCLLADPKNTPESSKRFIATVIAHELSHQWFGNLVTMKWWNDLWLNESFANMMEYIAVDALEPSWRIWEDFATNEVTIALRRDSLDGVQSVKMDVNHPDEISTLFDGAIVYAKGGRLLKMVRQIIGEDAFRTGLKNYFAKFAYQNTEGDDLWRELENASQKPIIDLMNAWISQPGLPLVTVEKDDKNVTLWQQRFFIGDHSDDASTWPIPLFSNQKFFDDIFTDETKKFKISGDIILNNNLGAHFVTKYDDKSQKALLHRITDGSLSTLDKICLLQDSPLLARAGLASSASLLPLAMSFTYETNEKVFGMAAMSLSELRKFVESEPEAKKHLKTASSSLGQWAFDSLGWDEKPGESDDDRERRSTALGLMSYGEDGGVIQKARKLFALGTDKISPEIRSIVLSTVVRHAETPETIEQLLDLYKSTASNDLKLDITLGLTSTKTPETVEKILKNIKNPEIIRPQDTSRWFAYLIRNADARPQAWQWLQKNWPWIKKTFGGDKSYDDFVRYSANALMTHRELEEFTKFFVLMTKEPGLTRTIELGRREIAARVELIDRDKQAVLSALARFTGAAKSD